MKISLQRRLAPFTLAATLIAGATLSAPSAMAQKATSPRNDLQTRTKNRVSELFGALENRVQALHLSGAQQLQLKGIVQKNGAILPAMRNGSSLSTAQKQSRVHGLSRQINAVFTPAQNQEIAAAKRESVGQLIGAASWVSGELGLSVAQQNKMQQIAMAAYQKSRVPARGKIQTVAVRDVVFNANSQFTRILTPPQKMKWSVIQSAASAEFGKQSQLFHEMFSF
ncbi:hypothetical protein B1R32_102117 [Abditibacterium utsteinense]|uniref:Uncharacterized protein n=1 Tax=Abditibacterium utsteinense TaxID=1960156 RepID=A0A2S8SWD9_9BACT|nr:hypothetical protein [Abditibacterium utsteinense]PQV65110.1 hypothetical protein B1R32_102117 [Abditibacterium utsteinense]